MKKICPSATLLLLYFCFTESLFVFPSLGDGREAANISFRGPHWEMVVRVNSSTKAQYFFFFFYFSAKL